MILLKEIIVITCHLYSENSQQWSSALFLFFFLYWLTRRVQSCDMRTRPWFGVCYDKSRPRCKLVSQPPVSAPGLSVMEGMDLDLDQELMQKFSCMGTTDKDILISEFQRLLGFQLNPAGCAFFLDMTNWWARGFVYGLLCAGCRRKDTDM